MDVIEATKCKHHDVLGIVIVRWEGKLWHPDAMTFGRRFIASGFYTCCVHLRLSSMIMTPVLHVQQEQGYEIGAVGPDYLIEVHSHTGLGYLIGQAQLQFARMLEHL